MEVAISVKETEFNERMIKENTIWDTIVFKEARNQILGGNMKLIISGGGLLSPAVLALLRCALGAAILEGYGQTECAGLAVVTHFGDYATGHVGAPLPVSHIKLVDVPEMDHFVARSGVGEICIKGEPNVQRD